MPILSYIPKTVTLDHAQINLIKVLEKISKDISRNTLSRMIKHPRYSGIYIHGPVGRGKTIIFEAFFNTIKKTKILYHYQAFIKFFHEESHKLFLSNKDDYILALAEDIASKYDFIFIDELEIRDIADAMIIQRFCEVCAKKGLFLGFTSNIRPDKLYENGLQRELFMKFIDFVTEEFFVANLDHQKDYRFTKVSSGKKVILEDSLSQKCLEEFEELVNALTKNKQFSPTELNIFGRKITFDKTYKEVLYVDIDDIINKELSYNDFLEITSKFNAVILNAEKEIPNDSNMVLRFINFIDNIYANNLLFVAKFSTKVADLYKFTKYKNEFKRAISRITEMNSEEYIVNSKYHNMVENV